MNDMEVRWTMRKKGGAEQFVHKEISQDISHIKTSMEDVLQRFGQQTHARAGQAGGKPEKEGQELSQEWHAWVVRMHKLNKEEGKVGPRRCGGKEICIKRTSFPTFDGNHKKWMDFRRVFKELVKISKLVPILKLAQLRSMLPEDAKKLITGVEEPAEAWKLLDEEYGAGTL